MKNTHTIVKDFWSNSGRKKLFYRIPLFYLLCAATAGLIFAGGYFVGKRAGNKTAKQQKILSAVPASEISPIPSPSATAAASKSAADTPQEVNEFSFWSKFEDTSMNLEFYYPPSWFAQRKSGTDIVSVHTPDDKYYLYLGLRRKGEEDEIQAVSFQDDKLVKKGTITIFSTKTDKYQEMSDGKASAYAYPKEIALTDKGDFEFAAAFITNPAKDNGGKKDFELLDERGIAEKILNSASIIQ